MIDSTDYSEQEDRSHEAAAQRATTHLDTPQHHDPLGISQHQAGAKLDAGKIRAALVLGDFAQALIAVSKVGTFGATKYTPHGWLEVPQGRERYEDAMLRHWLAHRTGEVLDSESKIPHLAHFAWNALAILELEIKSTTDMSDTFGEQP